MLSVGKIITHFPHISVYLINSIQPNCYIPLLILSINMHIDKLIWYIVELLVSQLKSLLLPWYESEAGSAMAVSITIIITITIIIILHSLPSPLTAPLNWLASVTKSPVGSWSWTMRAETDWPISVAPDTWWTNETTGAGSRQSLCPHISTYVLTPLTSVMSCQIHSTHLKY